MEEGTPISYQALKRSTPVFSVDDQQIGNVERVLDNERENIFDGIVITTVDGLRFVDAPEVDRITDAGVRISMTAAEAAGLPPPEKAAPSYRANVRAGRLGRLFGGGWRRH